MFGSGKSRLALHENVIYNKRMLVSDETLYLWHVRVRSSSCVLWIFWRVIGFQRIVPEERLRTGSRDSSFGTDPDEKNGAKGQEPDMYRTSRS